MASELVHQEIGVATGRVVQFDAEVAPHPEIAAIVVVKDEPPAVDGE